MESNERGSSRLSRLPLPRAAASHNTSGVHQDPSQKGSQLPRPSNTNSLRLKGVKPLSESANQTQRFRYGWTSQPNRPLSPVQLESQPALLDTTPPANDGSHDTYGDDSFKENASNAGRSKRGPRPSLSERTVETLSQIPPSPSPTRRRISVASHANGMAPPNRPASALMSSRPSIGMGGRAVSPSKSPFRPPSHGESSRQGISVVNSSDESYISTPSKSTFRGSKIAIPLPQQRNRDTSSPADNAGKMQTQTVLKTPTASVHKAKSMYDLRVSASKTSTLRPPAPPLKDLPRPSPAVSATTAKVSAENTTGSVVPKTRTLSKKASIPSLVSRTPRNKVPVKHPAREIQEASESGQENIKQSPMSSATLRATIAKAKAARRQAVSKGTGTALESQGKNEFIDNDLAIEHLATAGGQKTLQNRIRGAVTTGNLNIAAMGLKNLPNELRNMYDSDDSMKINWSEAVDLTKFIAADNELEDLPDVFFPDWSLQELQEDEEKTNIFGGLQFLDLHGNKLHKLPIGLRRLEQLHTLNLSNTKLELDAFDVICQVPNLKELNLANNNLQGAVPSSLLKLTNLRSLNLHGNRLTELPNTISYISGLQKLDVSDNKFETISLTSLSGLPLLELNLSHNGLSGVLSEAHFSAPKLQSLDLSFNRLESLCDSQLDFPNLKSLICDNNRLQKLPDISLLECLTIMTASENNLGALPYGMTNLKNLRTVNLSANQIKALDPQIANMENLTSLNLAANPLHERKFINMSTDRLKVELARRLETSGNNIDSSAPNGEQDSIGASNEGSEVELSRTKIKIEHGVLNLASTGLSSINPSMIDLNDTVHTIRLSNNDLVTFPVELLTHPKVQFTLKSLDLSHNQSLHSTAYLAEKLLLPALHSLYIVSTGLTSLEALTKFLSAPMLKELNISCHRMTGPVPHIKESFPLLTTLLATDNWFTSIEVVSIQGLEVVDISNNDIDRLPPKIGELGNVEGNKAAPGRLRAFECSGNRFRVPRPVVLEKGTEAVLRDLRRMVPAEQIGEEWRDQ